MKTQVLVVGTHPTLLLDGQAVVREEKRIVKRPLATGGYPTSIAPAEMAKQLLRYARGTPGFEKHAIDGDLRKQLERIAAGCEDGSEWLSAVEAAALVGMTYGSFMSRRSNGGGFTGVRFTGQGKGQTLRVDRASLERWIQARKFSSGIDPGADVKPYKTA